MVMLQPTPETSRYLKSVLAPISDEEIGVRLKSRKAEASVENSIITPEFYRYSTILIVEDDTVARRSLRHLLESWGCQIIEAADGLEALGVLRRHKIRLVLSDVDMPNMDGLELLRNISADFPEVSVLIVSSFSHERILETALARGAIGYIQKPFRLPELKSQVTYALRKLMLTDSAKKNLGDSAAAAVGMDRNANEAAREFARLFVLTSDLHHVETGTHIRRIGRLSKLLANLAGCPAEFSALIGDAAVLHDIGKLAIPDAILKKPGPLTPEEFDIMKTHPVLGGQILAGAKDPFLKMAHSVALHHHERWDGKGYPGGLVGEDCPLEARIVGVVDVYDALTERRVYKEPWPVERVQDFFADKSKNMFDPKLVNLLLTHYEHFETERLADPAGEHA